MGREGDRCRKLTFIRAHTTFHPHGVSGLFGRCTTGGVMCWVRNDSGWSIGWQRCFRSNCNSLKLLLRCHIQEFKAVDDFEISELSSFKDT